MASALASGLRYTVSPKGTYEVLGIVKMPGDETTILQWFGGASAGGFVPEAVCNGES